MTKNDLSEFNLTEQSLLHINTDGADFNPNLIIPINYMLGIISYSTVCKMICTLTYAFHGFFNLFYIFNSTIFFHRPVVRELYYLLADYYFKNKEQA